MANAISSSFENLVVLTTRNNIPSQSNTLISIYFTNILFDYDLLGFLDGTMPWLHETILPTSSTTPVSNLEFKLWKR
ncbi:hypothetical protein PVL29_018770 [Vitis rotundifolia]|uniref:Uncharacterized protein n=1 Tax=Vitis rotundifolia TaxID=103349 RepID=A0AA38Z615_VITRO|nr:hypothetical protein PVL29_018770 [Vitis rotundifolia]